MDRSFQEYFQQPRVDWLTVAGALSAALLLSLISRSVIDHPPTYDELLHMLSAHGILDTGDPRIADGYYRRAEIFSRLVALSYWFFGDTPVVARIPALMAGASLVALVVLWTSMRVGLVAGLVSGMCLAILPTTVELSVFSRFYTLHGLAIFVAAIVAFEATRSARPNPGLILSALVFIASISLALHLQITTLIALMAILAGVLGVFLYDWRRQWLPLLRSRPWHFFVGVTGLLCTAIATASVLGLAERFAQAPLWAAHKADSWHYYIERFGRSFPLLWPLFPLAVVAGLLRHRYRRVTVFALVVFSAAVVVHSFAAQKAMRYLFYVLPFMCIVMGLGFSAAVEQLLDTSTKEKKRCQNCLLVMTLSMATFVLALSQEGQLALRWLAGRPSGLDALEAYASESSWDTSSLPELATAARTADRVIASSGVKALYYFGRYDYEANVSVVEETDTGREYGLDTRTGRRVIGEADSLAQVISQAGSTLVIVDDDKLGHRSGVPVEAVDVLNRRCRSLGLPAERLVHAWVCSQ